MAKNWFITGTSRGFGRAWAQAALERGDRVAATARDTTTLADLVDRARRATSLPLYAGFGISTPEQARAAAQLADGIAHGNARLSNVEQVKRHRILPVFWEPGGDELTPTMKLKRKTIAEKYADVIEGMYAETARL